ncbi:hypothetical protein [Candidatus Poriferisodalis sp.]|uniref:hypothetical protein n=1 Tax=Candidatus Poriferisodalis sp. TaxID=3101277 RepID=UPI003C6F77D0
MPATPRTHLPAPLRLVDASPVRSRPHRGGATPSRTERGVERPSPDASGRFVLTVRALAAAARDLGLSVPSFQSPPRSDQLDRSIQRRPPDDCVVAVRVRGRPFGAVVADAIEGIVVCNELGAGTAGAARDELWRAVEGADELVDGVGMSSGATAPRGAPAPANHQPKEESGSPHPLDEAA